MLTLIGILVLLVGIALYYVKKYNKQAEEDNVGIVKYNEEARPMYARKEKPIIPVPINPYIPIILGVIVLLFAGANPFSVNDAGNRQVVQTLSGDLSVRFEPGIYMSGFWAKVETYPNNVTIQLGPEEKRSPEADYWGMTHTGTFSEGDQAQLGHTVKWDLPTDAANMLKIHKTYQNIDNLATTTLMQYQKETANYSCQRLSSEAHYSGGQSQLKDFFQDQLRNGQVLLVTETKTRKLEDGTEKQYIEVSEQLDEKGMVKRTESDIQDYNIIASFASIDFVEYDERIYVKLKEKIDAASDEATAKQQLITAQQEALTEKAKGEKLIAKKRADEEADKLEAVIRAEKEKLVAKEQALQAKYTADKIEQEGRAKAAANLALNRAGLTPQEKAEWNYKTKVGIAKELAKRPVPQVIMGGNENRQSGLSNAYTMEQMLLMMDKISKKSENK